MRAAISFLAAIIVALALSLASERHFRVSEALSYLVFGAALVISYVVIKRIGVRAK